MTAARPESDRKVRLSGLGGTDAARILGMSRFGGPMDVYLEKIGQTAPLVETGPMRWGKILEDPIAREYALLAGRRVRRVADTIRHPVHPFLFAHPDRLSLKGGTEPRLLEVKTASVFTANDFGEPGTDQVPPDYLIQVMHYLAVTGYKIADLAVLIGGQRFGTYTIPRDEDLVRDIVDEEVRFWTENVEKRVPPAIDGTPGSSEFLHRIRDAGTERAMDNELARLAFAYAAIQAREKEIEAEKDLVGNQVRDAMGTNRLAEGQGVRVVYSEVKGRRMVAWDKVVEAAKVPPSVVEEFTSVGEPTRSLKVTVLEP